jgi:hypothetical protein
MASAKFKSVFTTFPTGAIMSISFLIKIFQKKPLLVPNFNYEKLTPNKLVFKR